MNDAIEHARHVIIHYHIFKNAGTAVASALARNFKTSFASFDANHYNVRLWPHQLADFLEAHPDIAAISSHHLRPPAPALPDTIFHEILVLRNPLDRIRSMYDFYRQTAVNDDPLTVEAKRRSLADFLEYLVETAPNLLSNAQVNLVANGGARIPDRNDFSRAVQILTSIDAIGVVEELETCLLVAETKLRCNFPFLDLSFARENVSRGRAKQISSRLQLFANACGDALYHKLVSLNQLDSELANLAALECRRRLQSIPSAERDLQNFRKRVARRDLTYRIHQGGSRIRRIWKVAAKLIKSACIRPAH